MNTRSRWPERARERNDAVAGTVPLTVDLVSFTLGVRQDLGVRRDGVDRLGPAQDLGPFLRPTVE